MTLTLKILSISNLRLYLCQLFKNGHGNVLHHKFMKHVIFKHPWPVPIKMWPWPWKYCLWQFLALFKANILKMDLVTYYIIRLSNRVSLGILKLWFWACDHENSNIVHINCQLVLMPLAHTIVQHSIFYHPWCWLWNCVLAPEVYSCKCSTYIKVGRLKTHYHIRFCNMACLNILPLGLDGVTLTLSSLSMSIISFY